MDDTVHVGAMLVNVEMAGCIGGGLQFTFDDSSFQVNNDHMFRLQHLVAHPGWLNNHVTRPRIADADVASGPFDQIVFGQFLV